MILWKISTTISIKHRILATFKINKKAILTACMPLKYVENGTPNGVTWTMCDSTRICKPELPSFFKVSYRMCTVRHITIKILHGSHNLVWALTWVGSIFIKVIVPYQSGWNTNILPTHVKPQAHYRFLHFILNLHLNV